MTIAANPHPYFLGHSGEELARLEHQGAFLRSATRGLFLRAGVQPGMRVIDFGCGVGDVAFLAAELVGRSGEVVAFDRSPEAIELASARAQMKGIENVRFYHCDESGLAAVLGRDKFDGLVGRLVLIHQRDIAASLAALSAYLRPGAVLAFHEIDMESGNWMPAPHALYEQLWRWLPGLIEHKVFSATVARATHEAFERLGFDERIVVREGRLVRNDDVAANQWIAGFARSIAGLVRKLGVERPDDLAIDVLLERAAADQTYASSLAVPVYMVAASARLPS